LLDFNDQAIAAFGDALDEAGILRIVSEDVAKATDSVVDDFFVVCNFVAGPEYVADFFPGDQSPGAIQKNSEQLRGLLIEGYADTVLRQIATLRIEQKRRECKKLARLELHISIFADRGWRINAPFEA